MAGFRGGVAAAESVVCWWKQIAERLADGDSNAPMVLSGKVTKNSCVSACLGRRGKKKGKKAAWRGRSSRRQLSLDLGRGLHVYQFAMLNDIFIQLISPIDSQTTLNMISQTAVAINQ